MEIFALFFIAVFSILFIVAICREPEDAKNAWQDLAEQWQMPIIFDSVPDRIKLKDGYRGHDVTLYTSHKPPEGKVNCISLRRHQKIDRHTSAKDKEFIEGQISKLASVRFLRLPLSQIYIPMAEIEFSANTQTIIYEQPDLITDPDHLYNLLDPLCNMLELYLTIAAQGGVAIPILKKVISDRGFSLLQLTPTLFQQVVNNLVEDITQGTYRLGPRASKLICPYCFTRFEKHKLKLSWQKSVHFYGCRVCHQSNEFLQGQALAMLDQQMETDYIKQDDLIYLNWLSRRMLCDFDRVHIAQAKNEDVERFAVQIGNDTDEFRKPRYQQMTCTVSRTCHLSENTLRILKRTFGQVVVD